MRATSADLSPRSIPPSSPDKSRRIRPRFEPLRISRRQMPGICSRRRRSWCRRGARNQMDAAKTSGIFVHQYAGLPHGPAFEHWRERTFGACGLDIGPSRGDSIDCRLQVSVVDNIALAIPEGASAQYSRTQSHLADGSDDLVLIAAPCGPRPRRAERPCRGACARADGARRHGHHRHRRPHRGRSLHHHPHAAPRAARHQSARRGQAVASALGRRGRRDDLALPLPCRPSRAASRRRRPAPHRAAHGRSRRPPARHRRRTCKSRARPRVMRRPVSISCAPT